MALGSLTPSRSGGLATNPFQLLQREMNRLFDDVFSPDIGMGMGRSGGDSGAVMMPRMELRETDTELRISAELPGVAEQDIDVSLDDDVLTIRGEKRSERREERESTSFTERAYGTFQRSMRLPYRVDPKMVTASFRNGVLTVALPRNPAQEQARRIPVQGGDQPTLMQAGDQAKH